MSPRFQIILVIYIRTYPFIQSSLFFISTSYCYFVFLPGWHSGVIMVTEHNRLLMRRRLNADMVGVVFFFATSVGMLSSVRPLFANTTTATNPLHACM